MKIDKTNYQKTTHTTGTTLDFTSTDLSESIQKLVSEMKKYLENTSCEHIDFTCQITRQENASMYVFMQAETKKEYFSEE